VMNPRYYALGGILHKEVKDATTKLPVVRDTSSGGGVVEGEREGGEEGLEGEEHTLSVFQSVTTVEGNKDKESERSC